MAKISITKEFQFEMAHALWNYDGLCKNIHGHSYILLVTLSGEPISDPDSNKLGMIMDFGEIVKIVKEIIISKYDHSLVINEKASGYLKDLKSEMFERINIVPFQPTCENLIIHFADKLCNCFPLNVKLKKMRLYETSTSYAEWSDEKK